MKRELRGAGNEMMGTWKSLIGYGEPFGGPRFSPKFQSMGKICQAPLASKVEFGDRKGAVLVNNRGLV